MTLHLHIDDIPIGTVLRAVSASGTRNRMVYKKFPGQYATIWSIPVQWDGTKWREECSMVSNAIGRLSHIMEIVNGNPVATKIEIHC
jgi:hypothetical protein